MKRETTKTSPSESDPFVIQKPAGTTIVVTFARLCDHERTAALDKQLLDLVETYDRVICDLSGTEDILTDWLRWLQRLTALATRTGKRVILAGARAAITEKADIIGQKGKLHLAASVAAAKK